MEEQLQTICFISKGTFMGLLGTVNAEDIGFDSQDITQLGYINENWNIEFGRFDQERAEKSRCILVADEFPLENHYVPNKKFEFLIHAGTSRDKRVEPFKIKYSNLFDDIECVHENSDTRYGEIARNILENICKTEGL